MRIWKVDVLGLYKESHDGEIKRAYLTFLVDAGSSDEAFAAGPLVAETVAQIGPKWVSFESLVVTGVEFPYMIRDTTRCD